MQFVRGSSGPPDISPKQLDQPFELGNEGLSRETSTLVPLWHSRAIIQSQNFEWGRGMRCHHPMGYSSSIHSFIQSGSF